MMILKFLAFFFITNVAVADANLIKNKWPFYFFGPYFPPEKELLIDHKSAEALLCKHVEKNCKLDNGIKDIDTELPHKPNEYMFFIRELKSSPAVDTPVSGFFVHYYYEHFFRGEADIGSSLVRKKEVSKSFLIDLKGNRIPLKNYLGMGDKNFQDEGIYFPSYYRVKSVIPEPISGEEKEYWLKFATLSDTDFWFKLKTKVYTIEYSKLTIDYVDDLDASKAFLKNLIPGIETKMVGSMFGTKSFTGPYLQHWSLFPLYITNFDGEYLHLQLTKLNNTGGDLFKIATHPDNPRSVIQVPAQSAKNFPFYDTSKFSREYNQLEDPCGSSLNKYWPIKVEGKNYSPLVFKIRPDSLMEGLSFKPLIGIEGPTDPNTVRGNPNSWYVRYQKMVKDNYFMMKMTDEEYKNIVSEANKRENNFCRKVREKKKPST